MFGTRKLQFRKRTPPIVPITDYNWGFNDGAQPEGTSLTHPLVISGGTGPFTVRLRNQYGTIIQTVTSFVSGNNVSYVVNRNDGVGIYLDITDSLAQTYVGAYWLIFDAVWVSSVNLTASTYAPTSPNTVTLTANPSASTAGARTYTWYYRHKPNGGSYSTGFSSFASGSSPTQVTGTTASGITYQFYVNLSNAGGLISSNSIECVTT